MAYSYPKTRLSLRHHLKLLINLRWLIVLGQAVTIYFVSQVLSIDLSLVPMVSVLGFLVVLNLLTLWRSKIIRPITRVELWTQLSIDVLALTLQFYFSGGASNPFTGLYLIQVIIAAIVLTPFQTWMMVLLTVSAYIAISFYFIPIGHVHHGQGDFFNLHIHGMLLSFGISSLLVAFFVTRMARNMREQEQLISQYKERERADQVILNIGMAAATAAHELGTPLSTVETLIDELADSKKAFEKTVKGSAEIIDTLQSQSQRCKDALELIVNTSGSIRAEGVHTVAVSEYLSELIAAWQQTASVRDIKIHETYHFDPIIITDQILDKALLNIFNNAAEAANSLVDITIESDHQRLVIEVRDDGEGFTSDQITSLPQPMQSTKKTGFGIGLFLAHSVITKLGGTLLIGNRVADGAKVRVRLPWDLLLAEGSDE